VPSISRKRSGNISPYKLEIVVTVATVQNTRRSVIVVDDFLTNPDEIREFALKLEYRADNRYFRGQRSTTVHLWPGIRDIFSRLLGREVTQWEGHPTNGIFQFCVGGDQLVYHSDLNSYAGVIYLTPNAPPQAGTTTFRSKANGYRSVHEAIERLNREHCKCDPAQIEREMYAGKLLDKTAWEPIDVIGNVYNRLVLWDAKVVHAASEYFGNSIENGRLFQMFFFDTE
jgi:hypothetical protein